MSFMSHKTVSISIEYRHSPLAAVAYYAGNQEMTESALVSVTDQNLLRLTSTTTS